MPTPKVKQFTSWSFTRWNDWNRCPAFAKYKHLDKIQEAVNSAMQRGSEIGGMAENYTNGTLKRLPKELSLFTEEFKDLKKRKALVEENWGFTKDWTPCSSTDWNNCAVRVKMDAHYITPDSTLVVIDHKTGKLSNYKTEEYRIQLELYTLAGFKQYPHVTAVQSGLWFLDEGRVVPEEPEVTPRSEEARLVKLWKKRTEPMLADKTFRPKPNRGCQWCAYSKAKGGSCKY